MELTKIKIKEFSVRIPGLEGYNTVIAKIEENINTNPDIAIESCKSLIEGLCKMALKLISQDYERSNSLRKQCKNDFPFLIERTFNEVFENNVEASLYILLGNVIYEHNKKEVLLKKAKENLKSNLTKTIIKIAAIRHERGDISHGKIYPKDIESSTNLSKSIVSITDGICSYLIHEFSTQYLSKELETEKLDYDSESEYNQWLNNQTDNFTAKIDFSYLLYKNSYEKYEEIYYLDYQECLNEIGEEQSKSSEILKKKSKPKKTISLGTKYIQELVNSFDATDFWSEIREFKLSDFEKTENLNPLATKELIESFLFRGKRPLRDAVVECMNEKPTLKDRAKIVEALTDKIIAFANELNALTE